jgi:hypothetical protein
MALTLGELAELVRREDTERSAVADRIRVWTAEGLIETESGVSVGSGRPRQYDESAVFKVAVLESLSSFGLAVRKGKYAPFWHFLGLEVEKAAAKWAKGEDAPLLLEIADFEKVDRFGRRFFAFLHPPGHLGKLIHPRAESAHMINLSRLFDRIDARRKALAKAQAAESKKA